MAAEHFWTDKQRKKEKKATSSLQGLPKNSVNQADNRIGLKGEEVRDGLAQLVLTVVELLRDLMERQALRRIENNTLTDKQIENLGQTFMSLKNELNALKSHFNLKDSDLNLDLGPLGYLRDTDDNIPEIGNQASIVEILDKIIGKGVLVKGDVIISVAEVDLISLNLGVLLASVDKARELQRKDVSTQRLENEIRMLRKELELRRKQQGSKQC